MSAFDLLADLLSAPSHAPLAKAAKAAKTYVSASLSGLSDRCEDLRISANPQPEASTAASDSQTFATLRNPQTSPQSTQNRRSSQDSQDSQGDPCKAQPLCALATELGPDARQLLDCLLWLHQDSGALLESELAKATGWPLGMVFGVAKTLVLAGLVTKSHAGLRPSRRLLSELAQTRH